MKCTNITTIMLKARHVNNYSNNLTWSKSVVWHVKNSYSPCQKLFHHSQSDVIKICRQLACEIKQLLWKVKFGKSGIMRVNNGKWNMIYKLNYISCSMWSYKLSLYLSTLLYICIIRSPKQVHDFNQVDC